MYIWRLWVSLKLLKYVHRALNTAPHLIPPTFTISCATIFTSPAKSGHCLTERTAGGLSTLAVVWEMISSEANMFAHLSAKIWENPDMHPRGISNSLIRFHSLTRQRQQDRRSALNISLQTVREQEMSLPSRSTRAAEYWTNNEVSRYVMVSSLPQLFRSLFIHTVFSSIYFFFICFLSFSFLISSF